MVLSDVRARRHRPVRPAAERPGARHRLRGRRGGLHPHQRPRRRRAAASAASSVTVVFNKGGSETQRVKASSSASTSAATSPSSRSTRQGLDLKPLPLGDSDKVAGRRARGGHRQPAGLRLLASPRASSRPPAAACRRRTARPSPTASRPTPPSTRATPAARSSTASGKVIGINEQIASQGGGNDGLGFAVPINTAIRSLEQLKTTGKVQYAWMGVGLQTLTSDIARHVQHEVAGRRPRRAGLAGQPGGQGRHPGRRPDGHRPGPAVHHRRRRHHHGRRHRRSQQPTT